MEDYLEKYLRQHDIFQLLLNLKINSETDSSPMGNQTKSLELAKSFRLMGNRAYPLCRSDKDFHKVYECYAKSITHAPAGSTEIALAYSNLSAVLLHLGKHSECVQAIDCCLNSNYPEESKIKLYLRQIECLKIIDQLLRAKEVYEKALSWIENKPNKNELRENLKACYNKQVKIQLPFTYEEIDKAWSRFSIKSYNKEVPGVSDALSLRYTKSQGRHYVAERDIRPGELVLKNRPYTIVCAEKSRYQSCWECCKSLTNCVPCDHCEKIMFCSEKCKQVAWDDYHKVECQMLNLVFSNVDIRVEHLHDIMITAFRLLTLAIKEYGSIQGVKKAVQEMDMLSEGEQDPRTKGFEDGKLVVDKYMGFMSLAPRGQTHRDASLLFATLMMYHVAITTTILGKQYDPNWDEVNKNEDFIFATSLLARHMEIVMPNRTNVERCFYWTAHSGITSLSIPACFFNHSCVPNVFIVHMKDCVKVVCNRPIKKGEQLYLDYFGIGTYEEDVDRGPNSMRRKHLDLIYGLDCKCRACVNSWPVQIGFPSRFQTERGKYPQALVSLYDKTLKEYNEVYDIELKHGQNIRRTYRYLMDTVKKLSVAIEKLHENVPMPCTEMFCMQMCLLEFCLKLHSAFT